MRLRQGGFDSGLLY
uniref:Uncharacterized protein n=1 Tax=Arundo donax TaxID=35708 RepID=A0A0A9A9L9_ARUDO